MPIVYICLFLELIRQWTFPVLNYISTRLFYVKLMLLSWSTKPSFAIVLAFLINITYFYLTSEPLYCSDQVIEDIKKLEETLKYWQEDLEEVIHRYNASNLDKIPDGQLDYTQLKYKQEYLEAIQDGRRNVTSSIKELSSLRDQHKIWKDAEVVVTKRGTSEDISEASNLSNKRQR